MAAGFSDQISFERLVIMNWQTTGPDPIYSLIAAAGRGG